jgi:hypothetical protein
MIKRISKCVRVDFPAKISFEVNKPKFLMLYFGHVNP